MAPPKGYDFLEDCWDPIEKSRCELKLSYDRIDRAERYGPEGMVDELLHNVKPTLQRPARVFQGLKRDGEEDGLCYMSSPRRMYYGGGQSKGAPPGMAFVVFVGSDGFVRHWTWVDPRREGLASLDAYCKAHFDTELEAPE
jgi:hypothetical protein